MLGVDEFDERTHKTAQRVLDSLDRLDDRSDAVYARSRRNARRRLRCVVTIALSNPFGGAEVDTFRAWARAISVDGMSFIHTASIDNDEVFVGMEFEAGLVTWFKARIVRIKELQAEGFYEHGLQFLERL